MREPVEVENIEEIRQREGIEDVELWKEIKRLHAGDIVKLTLRSKGSAFETVMVRITSVHEADYRGKLVNNLTAPGLTDLHAGSALAFKASQIHSVVHAKKEQRA